MCIDARKSFLSNEQMMYLNLDSNPILDSSFKIKASFLWIDVNVFG